MNLPFPPCPVPTASCLTLTPVRLTALWQTSGRQAVRGQRNGQQLPSTTPLTGSGWSLSPRMPTWRYGRMEGSSSCPSGHASYYVPPSIIFQSFHPFTDTQCQLLCDPPCFKLYLSRTIFLFVDEMFWLPLRTLISPSFCFSNVYLPYLLCLHVSMALPISWCPSWPYGNTLQPL